jgi:large subunit ribosomal protein L9
MKVFLLKDVERVGLAGEIIKVKDGFADNFLIPRKLGVEVTTLNEKSLQSKIKVVEHRKEVVATKTSMLAEKMSAVKLTLKRKMHDDGKLYGAVSASELVDLLAEKGFSVSKSQVDLSKSIKEKGTFQVTIKLSSTLQPKVSLVIVPENK